MSYLKIDGKRVFVRVRTIDGVSAAVPLFEIGGPNKWTESSTRVDLPYWNTFVNVVLSFENEHEENVT